MANGLSFGFERHGDKENSPFFEEYLERLLEERDRVGLTQMIHGMEAIMLTVDPGHSIGYIGEICLMTPYHYLVTLESEAHWTHILRIDMEAPDLLIREVKSAGTRGIFRSLNEVYPIGARKPNSRYIGEVLGVSNLHETVALQKEREFGFFSQDEIRRMEMPGNLAISKPSPYTHNIVSYIERPAGEIRVYALGLSSIRDDAQAAYVAAKDKQAASGLDRLLLPIDHLATRVYSQNREVAILEWLSWSSYYYWGSYDITDQNSSTNVTRSVHHARESYSPAKVFTASNTPYFVNHLERLPSPTETFVRNYGPRLHHGAGKHRVRGRYHPPAGQGLPARRDRVEGGRSQTDLFQRLGTLLADHRVRTTLRGFRRFLYPQERGRTDPCGRLRRGTAPDPEPVAGRGRCARAGTIAVPGLAGRPCEQVTQCFCLLFVHTREAGPPCRGTHLRPG